MYGAKPAPLADRLAAIVARLENRLGGAFRPYALEQIHATLVGFEGITVGTLVINANYARLRGEVRPMDLGRARQLLLSTPLLPFTIQLGGFQNDHTYSFTSRGGHPYLRSFIFQDKNAVAVGWPRAAADYPQSLDRLRRTLNQANILHKYHRAPEDVDNDFFLVLGHVEKGNVASEALQETEDDLRDYLAASGPLTFPVTQKELAVVAYQDPTLPITSSRVYQIDALEDVLRPDSR
jgi:hypothetical protein